MQKAVKAFDTALMHKEWRRRILKAHRRGLCRFHLMELQEGPDFARVNPSEPRKLICKNPIELAGPLATMVSDTISANDQWYLDDRFDVVIRWIHKELMDWTLTFICGETIRRKVAYSKGAYLTVFKHIGSK
jgi:hypothetical protein